MQYDIFISYRRSSFESANLIANKLRLMGYNVFFDVETLRSGKFNEQLYDVIDHCSDFVVVLPPDALDRCENEEDWVRKEIMQAMKCKKNIIPVLLSGFKWPSPMPKGIEDLCLYQAVAAGEREFFDLSMQRLASYLISKPHRDWRRLFARVGITLLSIATILLLGTFIFRILAIPVCKRVVDNATLNMCLLDEGGEYTKWIYKCWDNMRNEIPQLKTGDELVELLTLTLEELGVIDNSLVELKGYMVKDEVLTDYQAFLVSCYGVNPTDCELFATVARQTIDALRTEIKAMQKAITSTDLSVTINFQRDINKEIVKGDLNSTYYTYMEFISDFPRKAIDSYYEVASDWQNFPKGVAIGLKKEQYQHFYKQEMKSQLEFLYGKKALLEKNDLVLNDLSRQIQMIEQRINSMEAAN
ncbi:MAG: toll/interleukin-1 receptor domain-containing protein [Alistipes sp.]|nr:toll/interleukin-1 receptor domain-containing protein [Alistipes sp.]